MCLPDYQSFARALKEFVITRSHAQATYKKEMLLILTQIYTGNHETKPENAFGAVNKFCCVGVGGALHLFYFVRLGWICIRMHKQIV